MISGLRTVAPICYQAGKCLYTTIRELVENSLDAAESMSQLPDIDVTMCAFPPCECVSKLVPSCAVDSNTWHLY